ncbi:unnamed protein product [Pleuronectes platessa]|uniref:Uncharacterized protein n=1 Tax=Pleuronectes platessa TaxID=8262 RepID=A0A9N7U4B4_PLEPL|nr:unnamed protein product [Pleuronectes platessa]
MLQRLLLDESHECVWSGEYDTSTAALCPRIMEQRATCLSAGPSVRFLKSYHCVSPADEKLAGTSCTVSGSSRLREAPGKHMLSQLGLPASNRDTLTLIHSTGEVLSLARRPLRV